LLLAFRFPFAKLICGKADGSSRGVVMSRFAILTAVLPVFLVGLLLRQACADEPPVQTARATKFIRLTRDAKTAEPAALETAIVRYRPIAGKGELVVDLIGVVHMGDRDYYRKLNRQFEDYDVLLYELVAPQGTRIPRGGRQSDNPIAMIQKMATVFLGLESQTEAIDYTRENFVHADMSPEEMGEVMRKRGDDGLTIGLGVAADMIRQMNVQAMKEKEKPARGEDGDLFSLLTDPQGPTKMKRVLAEQLASMDDPSAGIGQTLNRILVSDRNQAAMRVFQKELAKGHKKIGIFYGAAHMPDFDQRLRADFGLRPVATQWLSAWDLNRENQSLEGLLFKLLIEQ